MIRFELYILPLTALAVLVTVLTFTLTLGDTAENQFVTDNDQQISLFGDNAVQTAGAASAISVDGLVAHWSFDEEEGVVALDGSMNGNNGVLKGSPTRVSGKFGSALFFDGVDDYVFAPDNGALIERGTFTVTAWVKGGSRATGVIFSDGGYVLALNDKNLVWNVQGRVSISTEMPSEVSDRWVHVATVVDESSSPNTQLYIDGVRVLSSDISLAENNRSDLLIGRDSDGDYFNGYIDEVRIYSRALSETDFRELVGASSTNMAEEYKIHSVEMLVFDASKNSLLSLFSNMSNALQAAVGAFNRQLSY